MVEKTAAVVIIGNEILSGRTTDENARFLIDELHSLGVSLQRVFILPDDVDAIVDTVRECSAKYDFVFTSGGVGPTHDDVTIEGVARALGRPIVRHPELLAVIREFFGTRIDEARLRMADAPDGSELIYSPSTRWPVLAAGNVYILPGVPEIFRSKFSAIRERFRSTPFYSIVIFTNEDEFDIAPRLNQVANLNPDVAVGSYPNFGAGDYRVKITLEATEAGAVERARSLLIKLLPPSTIVRTE